MKELFFLCFMLILLVGLNAVSTVKSVDLNRYLGRWYQIAYYPNSFQPKDCGLTVADYSLNSKGKIIVLNTCFEDKAGKIVKKQATGKAWSVDKSNAKLKVMFFWPFRGDYWIVKLDKDYRYTVVSDPKQKYLWILSRKPELDKLSYDEIITYLKANGWNLDKLIITGKVQ